MAIAPPQDDILIRVQQRLAQRGITGAEAASIVAKIEAKLGRVSGSGAGMQRAVGQPSIPTPRGEPVDPRYAKFQVDPNDRLVARGLKPRQIAATPEEIAAEGMRFAAPTTQPVEKRGMFSSGARAFYGGLEDAGDFGITADMLAADNRVTFEVGNRFAQIQAQKRSRPMSEGAAAYAQASQGGAMSLLSFAADRPGAFLQGAIDQNLQSLGSTAASIVGAPLAGALAPALMGSGSGLAEASNELAAALEAEGVDVTDGGAVTRAMNTPDIRARVRDRVLTKSTVVGGADFATMGIASRIPGGKTFVRKVFGQAAKTGVEGVGGMAGEALSQVASGQELQTGDILSEGIGELLPGSAQVAALGARRLLNPTTPPPSSPASPTPGGPAPGGVGGNARPPSPPSTPPVDPMDAVADSLDERFKMKPSVLNPLAPPPTAPTPAPDFADRIISEYLARNSPESSAAPVGEPSADRAAQPEQVAADTETPQNPVVPSPMRRVDRPARPTPPTVTLNPETASGFNPSEIPNGSPRFVDRLGPFPRVPEGQQAEHTAALPSRGPTPAESSGAPEATPSAPEQPSRPASGQSTEGQIPQGSSPSPQSTREPWQMTRGEYVAENSLLPAMRDTETGRFWIGKRNDIHATIETPGVVGPLESGWATNTGEYVTYADAAKIQGQSDSRRTWAKLRREHEAAVTIAHAYGKPVPPEVLAEYGLSPNPPAKPDSSSEQQGTVTVRDGTAKDVGARRVEELRAVVKTTSNGWRIIDEPDGAALIHPTDDRVVRFVAQQGSGSSLQEARIRARAFAQDNAVASKPNTPPPGELVVKDIRVQPQPQGQAAAQPQTQEPKNGEETQGRSQGLLKTGTAAPAESSDPRGTGAASAKIILWGRRDGGPWLKLTSNTSDAEMKRRKADGWEVLRHAANDNPGNITKVEPAPKPQAWSVGSDNIEVTPERKKIADDVAAAGPNRDALVQILGEQDADRYLKYRAGGSNTFVSLVRVLGWDKAPAAKPEGMTDSQIRAAKRQAEADKKNQRMSEAAKKAAETKAFNARNPGFFTRGHIAEQIMRLARSLPDTDTQYGVLGNADDSQAPGDYISFSFTGKIPQEVLHAIDAEPHLRTLLRVVPSGGLGADWMGHLGVDEYVRQLRLTFYEGHGKDNYGLVVARRKLEHWRGGNAEADFLLWALDRIENSPDMRPDWEMVPAADITPGSTLKIIGEDFDATAAKYGEIVLSDGIKFPLQVLEAYGVPVDKGTMKKGTQEPAPKPETPDFGIEDAADPLAAVSDRIESTETITMDDGETATIYKLADGFEVVDSPEGVELRRRVGPGVQRLGTYSSVEDAIGSVAPKIAPENEWLPPKDDGEAFRAWAMSLVTGLESRVGMVRTATNEADEKGVFFTVSNKAGGQSTYGVRAFKGRAFVVESTGGYMNKGAAHVLSEHPNARTALVEAITLEDAHKPVKAEPAPVSTEEATKILADKGIIVTKTTTKNGTPVWELTGQTFDHKDVIGAAGGRYYRPKKTWSIYNEQAISKIAGTIGGGGTVYGGVPGQAAGVVADSDDDLARQRARERLDATPDERGTGADYARTVTPGTAALIRKGEAFGIPTDVATEQIEDIGMAMAAHRQGRKLFIIGNDAGSGKTFVLGGIIREMRAKFPAVVYVTMNQDLIEQIKRNLKDYDIGGVTFATYSDLSSGKVESTPGQLLILDEAHNIKNTESARGKNGKKAVANAGFTVFASATPYENPVQAEYLAPTGVFDEAGGHTEWAKIYGAAVRKWKDSEGTHEEVYWVSTKDSTKDALQAKGWLERKGVFTQRRIRLDPAMVQARFRRVPVEQKWLDLFNRVLAVYDDALSEWKDPLTGRSRDPRVAAMVAMHRENALRRILEAAKVNAAIDRAKEELAAGRKVAMFVETKSEREIGRYRKSNAKPNSESYTFPQMQAIMAEWEQDRAADRAAGDRGTPPPFSPAILTIAAAMHDAGIDETLPGVVDEIEAAFGKDAALYTGSVTPAKAAQNREAWRLGKFKVLIITMDKGGTGLSLHDTVGDQPTTQINVNMPWTATKVKQVSARTGRYGLKSKVVMEWLFSADIPFEKRLARRVGGRIRDMGATVSGINIASATKLADFDFKADEDIGDMALGVGTEPEADTNGTEEQYRQANRLEAAERRADDTSGDFFQTPHPIALFMARVAGITSGTKVLEPSAGMGRIVRYIPAGASLTMIEQHPGRVRKLEAMNRGKVVNTDFVQWAKDNKNTQDVVLMNPPFSRIAGEGWQDVSHVMAAWETLREGGRLVAVMSVGFTFHQDQQSAEFREWVESTGATVFKLPERAFKNSGTGVRTVLLIADKRTGDYADAGEYQVDSMEELPSLEDEVPSRALDRDEKPKEPAPKAANPAAPTPPKFSDSEGVFGQKTESITGTQRGMFGDISPEPTPEMKDRYPGIRRGESVADYEKRMGTTDTPEMFGGPTSGPADPGTPFRSPPDFNDRAAARLNLWADRAMSRAMARIEAMRRGEFMGSGVDPTPLLDLASAYAFKALASGITSKKGRALTKFVTERYNELAKKVKPGTALPSLSTVRNAVAKIMRAAGDDRENIPEAYAAARAKMEARQTKDVGAAINRKDEVKAAVADATAARPDVSARIIKAVKAAYRQGKAEGMRTASDALKPLIRQARDAAKRARQVAAIETRGAVDAAKNAAADQAATEKGIRDQAVRLVQETPIAGRGKYLRAVAGAKTMGDLARILHRLRGDLAKETGRHFAARAERLAGNMRKLDSTRRENARKLLDDIRKMYDHLRDKDTGTARREELAAQIREAFEALNSIFHEQRNADKVYMQGRAIVLAEHRDQMMDSLQKQAELPPPENGKEDREPAWLWQKLRKYGDFRTLMQILDRKWDESGIFAKARRAMGARRTAELAKNQEFIDRAEQIVKANGYESWSDFMERTEGAMGDSGTEWVNIDLGPVNRITVGQAMALYAQDAETKELMHAGQPWKLNRDGKSFVVDDYKLAELESKLTPGQKRIARQINQLRSDMQFERADGVYKRITGNHMVQVDGHYPRKRILDKSGSEDTIDIAKLSMGEWAVQSLENSGFTITRVKDKKTPLLLEDFGSTQVRSFQGAEMMIQRAEMVKYLKATLFNPTISDAIAQRYGGSMMKRLTQVVAEYSGNSAPESDKFIRKIAAGSARSMTQVNPGTWARNLSTVFRLPLAMLDGKLMGPAAVAMAIPEALANWRSTLKTLMEHSPDLRHRWSHAGASISMMTTAATADVDSHFADASKATLRQLVYAAKAFRNPRAAARRLGQVGKGWNQILDSIKVGNAFDAFAAVVAYHAVRSKAPESLSPRAGDKWAARKAADAFLQTANTNDLLNANEWQTDAKRNTMTAMMLTFTSDIAKAQNLLFLANKRGGKARAMAIGAVASSIAWSVAIKYVLGSLLGDDEDKREADAASTAIQELVSLLPTGSRLSPIVEWAINPRGKQPPDVLDTPFSSIGQNFTAMVNALSREEPKYGEAAYRAFRLLDVAGNPLGPISGMVRRAVKNYDEN